MSESELISVVISCSKRGRFVHEALESVRRQTYPRWEVIVVVDGAEEPETADAVEDLERRAVPGVRIVRVPRGGLPYARNRGMELTRGAYVIPLDSDDLLEPEMMAVCLEAMRSHPEAGFAYFDTRVFGDRNYVRHPGGYNLYRLMQENFLTSCLFVRREAWEQAGGYDEGLRRLDADWRFAPAARPPRWHGHYLPEALFRDRARRGGPRTPSSRITPPTGRISRKVILPCSRRKDG